MIELPPELMSFLREEESRARNDELYERAATALKSYNGDYYGDEVDGRSKVVSRDVAEVIDHMQVSILRTFVSGDRVVEFEPDGEEMESVADDATELIHRDFARNGYGLLHDWLKAGNIETVGVAKAGVYRKQSRVEEVVPELALDSLDGIIEMEPAGEDPEVGPLVRIVTIEEDVEFKDDVVPLEEFRIAPDARNLDSAVYVAHASIKTISDLVEMGFPMEEVEDLTSEDTRSDTLSDARDNELETDFHADRTGATRRVELLEEYVRYDADGDGIAERLCIHRVGDKVLSVEACDYQPFVIYCPYPMQGRLVGHALADKVTDIQRVNTVLMRLSMDGLYRNLAPRTYVEESSVGEHTYADLLNVVPGGVIRYKGMNAPEPEPKNDVSATAWNAIEFMIGQRESRTGITRLNQGLDADTLNKTATGTALMQAQGQQMEEYLARNFAESVAKLMRLKLKLLARHGRPQRVKVEGQYREIDPSEWPEEMNVVIRVGLGSGKKEQRLQNRMMILQLQERIMEAVAAGALPPIVDASHIYKSVAGLVKDSSLGSPDDFVADPTRLPPPPPEEEQPDPAMVEAQMKMELERAKVEAKMQADFAERERKAEAEFGRLQMEATKASHKAQLDEAKLAHEQAMAEARLRFEQQLAAVKAEFEAKHKQDMSDNREGGRLDR